MTTASLKANKSNSVKFIDLPLNQLLIQALDEIGYDTPTPIQAEIIPTIVEGRDVIGQAQTGTGKTAAFALPILSNIKISNYDSDNVTQALILAPTRELAIQVADSFRKYGSKIKGLVVATICGGQDYKNQLQKLKTGSHIVVGTPGRIMDHMERGTLNISSLTTLVLDEADEMLRMGFIDDINWILERSPAEKQIALFSATMPSAIRNIAIKYLKDPVKVNIEATHESNSLISQYYWSVNYSNKIATLLRILEISKYDGMDAMIVFARTKVETILIGEQLLAHGHRAIVLNGDIDQKIRERSIKELKAGRIDILIATDVAARGLDVDRITHVVNYDMPHDEETYTHRIGRTGRAGRSGVAISFATGGETSKLRYIERFTKTPIEKYKMPTVNEMNKKRVETFKARILNAIKNSQDKINVKENFDAMGKIINQIAEDSDNSVLDVASALAVLLYDNTPLLLTEADAMKSVERAPRNYEGGDRNRNDRGGGRSFGGGRDGRGRSERSGEGRGFKGRSERSGSGEGRSFGEKRSFGDRNERSGSGKARSFGEKRSFGDRNERSGSGEGRSFGERRSFGDRNERSGSGEGRSFGEKRSFGDRNERSGSGEGRSFGEKRSFGDRNERSGSGERRSFGEKRSFGERGDRNVKSGNFGGRSEGKPFGSRDGGRSGEFKPRDGKFSGERKEGGFKKEGKPSRSGEKTLSLKKSTKKRSNSSSSRRVRD